MCWQIGEHGEFAFDDALGLDVCCAETVAVLVEVVLLHLVHCRANLHRCIFLIGLDVFHARCVPCEVSIAWWCGGKCSLDAVVCVRYGFHLEADL